MSAASFHNHTEITRGNKHYLWICFFLFVENVLMINFTLLITWAADWICHMHLLPHHLVSLGSSQANAVIKSTTDYSAVSPGTITDWLLCHQQRAKVGFLCFHPLVFVCLCVLGVVVFFQRHDSPQGTRPLISPQRTKQSKPSVTSNALLTTASKPQICHTVYFWGQTWPFVFERVYQG